jgi:hypothetical protein
MPNVLNIVLDDVNGWLTLAGSYGGRLYDHVLHLPGNRVDRGPDNIIQTTKLIRAGVWTGDPVLLADSRTASAAEDFLAHYVPQPGGAGLLLDVGLVKTDAPWVVPQEFFDLYPLDEIVLPERAPDDLDDIPAYGRLGVDKIAAIALAYSAWLPTGALSAANFVAHASDAATAPLGRPQFIFNTTTGVLFFDADGLGSGVATRLAARASAPAIGASDFQLL